MSRRSKREYRRSPLGWPAWFGLGTFVLVAGLVAGLVASPARAATAGVAAANYQFTDVVSHNSTTTIHVGDSVTWTFAGETHTVTSGTAPTANGGFDSGFKNAGDMFTNLFTAPGTYPYFCQIHADTGMIGSIVVVGDTTQPPPPTPQPTPRPTPRQTPAPTLPPPTVAPTVAATLGPPVSPSASPTPSSTPATTASAVAEVSPSATTASPAAGPSEPGTASGSGAALVVVAILAALGVAGAVLYLQRRGAG